MIARIWHGITPTSKADDYLKFLKDRAIPDYRSVSGNLAVFIMRRVDGDVAHFLTLTHWNSFEAIQAFSGVDVSKAKYYPEDSEFLIEFEPTVQHFEVFTG